MALTGPPIAPVAADAPRPFWSVMIPTWEPRPEFLAAALESVLAQDPGPDEMEIVLCDDGSRRVDVRAVIPAAQRARVTWVGQPQRAGIGRNWNACLARARGRWVHLLHQDDLLRPGFYARLRAGLATAPEAGAAFCRDVVIDAGGAELRAQRELRATPGILADWIEHIVVALHLRASALVVRRDVYETLGGFRLDLDYALDWDMWKRLAAAYPLWYEPAPLACYRRHGGSATNAFLRSGANIAEIGRSIALSAAILPPAVAAEATRRARLNYTRYAVDLAWQALAARQLRTGLAQLREARRLSSTRVVAGALRARLRAARRAPGTAPA